MTQQETLTVIDSQGRQGKGVIPSSAVTSEHAKQVLVRFTDGRELWVPLQALVLQEDGSYFLNLDTTAVDPAFPGPEGTPDEVVVPLVAEAVKVAKRPVVTGGVRVTKIVQEREEQIDEPLLQQTVEVERVPINRVVEGPVEMRYEGDTVIIPVLEEVLVVEKRWMLKEEVHIHRQYTELRHQQQVRVRNEEAIIERKEGPSDRDKEK